jgi:hypothetical protein
MGDTRLCDKEVKHSYSIILPAYVSQEVYLMILDSRAEGASHLD